MDNRKEIKITTTEPFSKFFERIVKLEMKYRRNRVERIIKQDWSGGPIELPKVPRM